MADVRNIKSGRHDTLDEKDFDRLANANAHKKNNSRVGHETIVHLKNLQNHYFTKRFLKCVTLCTWSGMEESLGWRSLRKILFVFKKDDSHDTDERGEYVTINYNEISGKNHGVETNIKEKDQRMYFFPNDNLYLVCSLI